MVTHAEIFGRATLVTLEECSEMALVLEAEAVCDLLDVVYHEPNAVTKAAIEEAMNRKDYPTDEVYGSVEDLFKALDIE